MQRSYQPVTATAEHRGRGGDETSANIVPTRPREPASPEPSRIVAAMSWLGSAFLEGFALYGQSVWACPLNLRDDPHAPAEKARGSGPAPSPPRDSPWLLADRSSHEIDIHAWLASAPSQSPGDGRRWLRLVAVWPRRRSMAAKRWSCVRLDMPDDQSLHGDVGEPHAVSPIPECRAPYRRPAPHAAADPLVDGVASDGRVDVGTRCTAGSRPRHTPADRN